jgi:hypothetical protein
MFVELALNPTAQLPLPYPKHSAYSYTAYPIHSCTTELQIAMPGF